jgi:hypothetical protein
LVGVVYKKALHTSNKAGVDYSWKAWKYYIVDFEVCESRADEFFDSTPNWFCTKQVPLNAVETRCIRMSEHVRVKVDSALFTNKFYFGIQWPIRKSVAAFIEDKWIIGLGTFTVNLYEAIQILSKLFGNINHARDVAFAVADVDSVFAMWAGEISDIEGASLTCSDTGAIQELNDQFINDGPGMAEQRRPLSFLADMLYKSFPLCIWKVFVWR